MALSCLITHLSHQGSKEFVGSQKNTFLKDADLFILEINPPPKCEAGAKLGFPKGDNWNKRLAS